MLRVLPLSRSLSHVPWLVGVVFGPSVAVVVGRRFRPTLGHLQSTSMFIMLVQQQSEPLVEEWNMLTTIGRRGESAVGCKQVFSVLMDAAVLTCTCLRLSVVVKYNQLYSEVRNVRACFCDGTTRMLCFVLQDSRGQHTKIFPTLFGETQKAMDVPSVLPPKFPERVERVSA